VARIAGVDLPRDKGVEVALTYIFGIGRTTASKIVEDVEPPDSRAEPDRGRGRPSP